MKQTTISVQDISGTWAQIGAGRLRGIQPSDIELSADTWGAKDATFTLTRELFVPWPEIQAFAPVEVTVGGVIVWRGRIVDAPTNSATRSISVRCEGWQAHLDDDQYERVYVHTDITQWQDARSFLDADLTLWKASGVVTTGDGAISLSWPVGTEFPATASVGVVLDLGPSTKGVSTVELTYRRLTGTPTAVVLACRSANDIANLRGGTVTDGFTPFAINTSTTTPQTVEASVANNQRYVCVLIRCDTTYTPTLEDGIIIDAVQVFTDAAYESGGVSVLRGDTIIKDALNTATIKLSADQSLIDSTGSSFYIPEFAPSGPRTPRQAIESVNAFYDWRTRIDESDRFVFEDRTGEAPAVSVGRWGSSSFEDASSASGDEIFNKAIVSGQDAANQPIREIVTSGDLSGAIYEDITVDHLANPGFEVDTSGWAATTSTITRSNTAAHTGTYSGRWDNTGASDALASGDILEVTLTGTFLAGVRYHIYPWMRTSSGTTTAMGFQVGDFTTGDVTPNVYNHLPWSVGSTFSVPSHAYKTWIPKATTSNVKYRFTDLGSGKYFYIDDMTIEASLPTIVDRRQFTRAHTLDASFMLTDSSANRLGKIYLEAHRTTPFKGQGQAVGHNALRDYTTGQPLGPERLLTLTDRQMFFDDRLDPDTGAVGRVGRIVNVRYTPATDTASFDIDNSRKDFDALLERLGVSIGQIR